MPTPSAFFLGSCHAHRCSFPIIIQQSKVGPVRWVIWNLLLLCSYLPSGESREHLGEDGPSDKEKSRSSVPSAVTEASRRFALNRLDQRRSAHGLDLLQAALGRRLDRVCTARILTGALSFNAHTLSSFRGLCRSM